MANSHIGTNMYDKFDKDGYALVDFYEHTLNTQEGRSARYYGSLYHNKNASNPGIVIMSKGVLSGTMTSRDDVKATGIKSGPALDYEYILVVTSPNFLDNILGNLTDKHKPDLVLDMISQAVQYQLRDNIAGPIKFLAISNGTLMFHALASHAKRQPDGKPNEYMQALEVLDNVVLCCAPRSIMTFGLNTLDYLVSSVTLIPPIYTGRTIVTKIGGMFIKSSLPARPPAVAAANRSAADYSTVSFPHDLHIDMIYEYRDCGVKLIESLEDFLKVSPAVARSFCISLGQVEKLTGHGEIYENGGNMPCVKNLMLGQDAETEKFIVFNRAEAQLMLKILDRLSPVNYSFESLKKCLGYVRNAQGQDSANEDLVVQVMHKVSLSSMSRGLGSTDYLG